MLLNGITYELKEIPGILESISFTLETNDFKLYSFIYSRSCVNDDLHIYEFQYMGTKRRDNSIEWLFLESYGENITEIDNIICAITPYINEVSIYFSDGNLHFDNREFWFNEDYLEGKQILKKKVKELGLIGV